MSFARIAALPVAALLGSILAMSQTRGTDSWKQALEEAYAQHLVRVQQRLPPHSGLPCLLDLSKPDTGEGAAGRKWEDRFTGMMGVRPISDPGVSSPVEATSISTTTTEYVGSLSPLPARECDAVVIAKPAACSVHLAYNRRFVYSDYVVEISEVLKGKRKSGFLSGRRITAALFGGTVRFTSGHEASFIVDNNGFLEIGGRYLLFVWKPVRPDDTYVISEAYRLQSGRTFPVTLWAPDAKNYDGMPVKDFEAKVKAAIAKNQDAM